MMDMLLGLAFGTLIGITLFALLTVDRIHKAEERLADTLQQIVQMHSALSRCSSYLSHIISMTDTVDEMKEEIDKMLADYTSDHVTM